MVVAPVAAESCAAMMVDFAGSYQRVYCGNIRMKLMPAE